MLLQSGHKEQEPLVGLSELFQRVSEQAVFSKPTRFPTMINRTKKGQLTRNG